MSTRAVEIQEADANLQELLSLVREGTEIILMEGDKPLARIAPVEPGQRIAGLHAHLGKAWMSEDFDEPLPDAFR